MDDNKKNIQDITPATLKVALGFFLCVSYFIGEIYFWSSEYYVETPPYILVFLIALILSSFTYNFLKRREPERTDTKTYVSLACLGFALLAYAVIPRLNILTDSNGLNNYTYVLDENLIWQSSEGYPPVDIYLPQSRYWQQFQAGDESTLQLRNGGLGIWLINMDKVYEDQKKYYDCDGFVSCMLVDSIDLNGDT